MPTSSLPPFVLSHLEGLASLGVTFVKLHPGKKVPMKSWKYYADLHRELGGSRIDLAVQWLKKGAGVAYLPGEHQWVLDCDSPETTSRVQRFCLDYGLEPPVITTPSLGTHRVFRFPEAFCKKGLKK